MLLKSVGIDMYVLKFDTLQAAQARSRAEAAKHIENHTTELWWGVVKCDSEYWLVVSDGTPDAVEVADDSPLEPFPDPLDAQAAQAALVQNVVQAAQQRLDTFARTRGYDGVLSACTYATSTVPKFAAEGQAAVNMRDATWARLYELLDEVQAGTRPVPAGFADIEPELPALEWPT